MKVLTGLLLMGLAAASYADSAPSIADYTQGLDTTLPSTQLDKSYLPVTFTTFQLNNQYQYNKNITSQSTENNTPTSSFNIQLTNSTGTTLYAYFSGSPQASGFSGVSYCTLNATASTSLTAPNNPACVDPAIAANGTGGTVYLYVASSASGAYNPYFNPSSCTISGGSVMPQSSPVSYAFANDGQTSYAVTISSANSCNITASGT